MAKKRVFIGSMIFGFVTLAILAAIVGVFALPQQNFGGDFYIYFNKPTDITAQVQASYQVLNGNEVNMVTSQGKDTINFTPGSSENMLNEFHNNSTITLTPENNSVVLKYKFSNTGSDRFVSMLAAYPTSIGGADVTATFSRNGVDFKSENIGLSLDSGETGYYYVKLSAESLTATTALSGKIDWDMQTISNTAEARIGFTTYETFAAAYAVATTDTVITVMADTVAYNSNYITKNVVIASDSVDGVTLETPSKLSISSNTVRIGINNGSVIKVKCLDTLATEIFRVTSSGKLVLGNVKLIPNGTDQRGIYTDAVLEIEGGEISGFTNQTLGAAIRVDTNSTVTIKKCKLNNNSSYEKGGAIYTNGIKELVLENCELIGNTLTSYSWKGGAAITSDGQLKLVNCKVNQNTGARDGGAIYAVKKFTVIGGEICNNSALEHGGAICSFNELVIDGATINNNSGLTGGALYVAGDGTKTFTDVTFENNSSNNGGALYVTTDASVNVNGGKINNNTANNNGAGIWYGMNTTGYGKAILDSVNIKNNTAANSGGGVYASHSVKILGGEISGNTGTKKGGGIYLSNMDTFEYSEPEIEDCVISNNTSETGGGIYSLSNFGMTDTQVNNNTATTGSGGGVYVQGEYWIDFSGGEISGNVAYGNGGGVYFALQHAAITEFSVSDIDVINNSASGDGGGIYLAGSPTGCLTIENANINKNTAGTSGGGVYVSGYVQTSLFQNSQINENSAGVSGGGVYGARAGISTKNVTISNNKLTNNASMVGGAGLYLGHHFELEDSTISSNTGSINGGGIYIVDTELEPSSYIKDPISRIKNTTITNNSVSVNGGGIYIKTGDVAISNGSVISNNIANNGGGIYSTGDLTLSNTEISSNSATSYGGGLYTDYAIIDNESLISKNSANYGGGIYARYPVGITNTEISENTATYNGGGAYIASDSSVELSKINSNIASQNGGGIYTAASITLYGTEISSNSATFNGGGIYMYLATGSSLESCVGDETTIISNNTATQRGGGIYTWVGNGIMNVVQDITISQNSAGVEGGGICSGAGELILSKLTISSNSAGVKGAGVYSSSYVRLTSVNVTNNNLTSTTEWRGGAGIMASRMGMFECTVSSNTGANDGGGMYILTSADIEDSTISNNTVTSNGGGICCMNSATGNGTFNLIRSVVSGNSSSVLGGGIYVTKFTFNILNSEIKENICNTSSFTVQVGTSQTVYRSMGGGIAVGNAGIVNFYAGSISTNKVASTYNSKSAIAYGANVFVDDGGSFYMKEYTETKDPGIFTAGYKHEIAGFGSVVSNYATSMGEGVFIYTGGYFEMSAGTINNCRALVGAAIANTGTMVINGGAITGNLATNTTSSLNFTNASGASIPVGSGITNAGRMYLGEKNGGLVLDADICLTYQNLTSTSNPTYGNIELTTPITTSTPYRITLADISVGISNIISFLAGTYKPEPSKGSKMLEYYCFPDNPLIGGAGVTITGADVDVSKFIAAQPSIFVLIKDSVYGLYLGKA